MQIQSRQQDLNERWRVQGVAAFELGIGVSTGEVAAALLGSEERLEYTIVGDTVNLSQRLQDLARPGGHVVMSEATARALSAQPDCEKIEAKVKGREAPVSAYKIDALAAMRKENA